MAIGPIIAGGALLLLALGKKKPAVQGPSGPSAALTTLLNTLSTTITKDIVPYQPTTTIAGSWLGTSGGEVLLKALSLIGGAALTVGLALGPVAGAIAGAVVIVVIAAVVLIGAAIQNNEWERAATQKGWVGLREDYVRIGVAIGQNLALRLAANPPKGAPPEVISAWPTISRMWAGFYAAGVMVGYNQVSYGAWGVIDGDNYWADRAMYVHPNDMSAAEQAIIAATVLPAEQAFLPKFSGNASKQAQDWGLQFGRVLWGFMCARGSMVEPWQATWATAAARHESVGSTMPGATSGWFPRPGLNLMMYGLQRALGNETAFRVQSFDPANQWVNPAAITLGSNVNFYGAGAPTVFDIAKTVAYPYQIDWFASSQDAMSVTQAPENTKPTDFAGYSGRRLGRFATMTRGRYGR